MAGELVRIALALATLRSFAWVAVSPLALSGCAESSVSLGGGARTYVATDYPNVLDRFTRSESVFLFDELERALTVTATFESWDFRWA